MSLVMSCNCFHLTTQRPIYSVLGDFNLDVGTQRGTELIQCPSDHGLHQLIDQPTRTIATSALTIDTVFTSHPENLVDSRETPAGITDHDLVSCVRKQSKSTKLPPK